MIPVDAAVTIPPSAISSPSGEYLSEVLSFPMMSVFGFLFVGGYGFEPPHSRACFLWPPRPSPVLPLRICMRKGLAKN